MNDSTHPLSHIPDHHWLTCICFGFLVLAYWSWLKKFLLSAVLISLYKSLVRPYLENCSVIRSPHYTKDKVLLERVQHRMFSESFCSLCPSSWLVTVLYIFVSSANFENITGNVVIEIINKNIRKSIGPNTDPCGTPLHTRLQLEYAPSRLTPVSYTHLTLPTIYSV